MGNFGAWARRRLADLRQQRTRGQALVYVGVMMMTLLAFAAIATDTGLIWLNRRFIQNAADAAALAGIQELTQDPGKARTVACDYAKAKNGTTGMVMDCSAQSAAVSDACSAQPKKDIQICRTYVPGDTIRVTTHKRVNPIFGMALGWDGVDVEAHAKAVVGSLKSICAFPLFQTQDRLQASGAWQPDGNGNFVEFNAPTIMKTNSDDSNAGNFLFLEANGSGSKDDIRDAIGSPAGCGGQLSGTATTATGNAVGPLDQGMEIRAALWNDPAAAGYCPDTKPTFDERGIAVHSGARPSLAGQAMTPENCYRMVKIPMLSGSATDYNGTKSGTVKGFLVFYISNWCGQNSDPEKGTPDAQHCPAPTGTSLPALGWGELWGYYLKYEAVTDLPINPYDGLGTKVFVLVD